MRCRILALTLLFVLGLTGTAQARADIWIPFYRYVFATEGHFRDLDPDSDVGRAADWCFDKGVFLGDVEGNFHPNAPVSRAQLVVLAQRIGWQFLPQWAGDNIHITRLEFADRYSGFTWGRSPWHHDAHEKLRRSHLALLLYRHQGQPITWRPMVLTGYAGLRPNAEIAWRLANYAIDNLTFLGGYARSGHIAGSQHYTGDAFDAGGFRVTGQPDAMHVLRDWLRQNWFTLHVRYIIHGRLIYWADGPQRYRGSNGHYYHVHTSFWR